MAVTLTDIETKVRYLIGDNSTSMIPGDIHTYGSSAVFTLTEDNVISVSTVLQNDVELGSSEWSFDSDTNKVTVSASLTSGDNMEIQYTYYPNYSSTEIQNYVQASLVHISANNIKDFIVKGSSDTIYPEPDDREINLISSITRLLIEPGNKSYRLPDFTINVPSDLPTDQKIKNVISGFKKNSHGIIDVF